MITSLRSVHYSVIPLAPRDGNDSDKLTGGAYPHLQVQQHGYVVKRIPIQIVNDLRLYNHFIMHNACSPIPSFVMVTVLLYGGRAHPASISGMTDHLVPALDGFRPNTVLSLLAHCLFIPLCTTGW